MITKILTKNKNIFSNILPYELSKVKYFEIDLSIENREITELDISNTDVFEEYLSDKLLQTNSKIAIGGYAEDRFVYQRSPIFGKDDDARTIHLGVDIWCAAGTPIFAFMDSKIHSLQNNDGLGDYGSTIILEHVLENTKFYTLYGHLSLNSLKDKKEGQEILTGNKFAEIGDCSENGQWYPHLHFQIIADMLSNKGDFWGVVSKKELKKYLKLCPDPNLILSYK